MPIQKLLFIDTNIWLDFYRARNESSLALLDEAEKISDRIIVTYQLESEFKRNRQRAISEGLQELSKSPAQIPRLGIFSDSKATGKMSKNMKAVETSMKNLKARLRKALADPAKYDPIYKASQRIFHREDQIVLNRDNKQRHLIRRRAFRRFLHGCPPRKPSDTSIGDAINWEWMIECAKTRKAELVIVSRDSDYGLTFENKTYVNDHLKQEFSERVSRKRSLLLYTKLTDALNHFSIPVSAEVTKAESELVESSSKASSDAGQVVAWANFINEIRELPSLKVSAAEFARFLTKKSE